MVEDVGFEPGILRATAAALIDEGGSFGGDSQMFANQAGGFGKLVDVIAVVGHGVGDTVGRENEVGVIALFLGDLIPGLSGSVDQGLDESRVVVKDADFVEAEVCQSGFAGGFLEVFEVLSATGVGTESGGDEGEDLPNTFAMHLTESLGKEGVPVSISPIDREGDISFFEFSEEIPDQFPALAVDGADAVEMVVVFGDLQESFARDVAAAQDVFEEGDDILSAFRSAEGEKEKRVVGGIGEGGQVDSPTGG